MNKLFRILLVIILTMALVLSLTACDTEDSNSGSSTEGGSTEGGSTEGGSTDDGDTDTAVALTSSQVGTLATASSVWFINELAEEESINFAIDTSVSYMYSIDGVDEDGEVQENLGMAVSADISIAVDMVFGDSATLDAALVVDITEGGTMLADMMWYTEEQVTLTSIEYYISDNTLYARITSDSEDYCFSMVETEIDFVLEYNPVAYIIGTVLEDEALTVSNFDTFAEGMYSMVEGMLGLSDSTEVVADTDDTADSDEEVDMMSLVLELATSIVTGERISYTQKDGVITAVLDVDAFNSAVATEFDNVTEDMTDDELVGILGLIENLVIADNFEFAFSLDLTDGQFGGFTFDVAYDKASTGYITDGLEIANLEAGISIDFDIEFGTASVVVPDNFDTLS